MDRRHAAGALLALAVCIASSDAAPTASNQTALDLYDGAAEGCYYNFQHYGEGDRIMTNEPCLNCTCHNRMLMCYLRVCPFTKPIGQDCTVEKRADQCCPIVTCPDVPVDLLTSTSTTSPAEYGASGVGKLDKYGCSIEGKFFPEGAKVPPTPNKPCEHCYCIRNMTTCVMQECTLHVDGCTPIYHKDVCCPVRYSCDHAEDEIPLLDDMTTTVRPTPGFLLTTTTVSPVTQMSQDCVHDDQVVPDGALIKTEKACEHCYCMKGDIVCVVQECGTPMENEGKNCTSQPPKEGQCCPDTYICEGDEVTPELSSDITTPLAILEELTTLSPPRRAEGSDYRKETDEPYTEKSQFPTESEGSGYEQTIPSFDVSSASSLDDQGSGYERSTLPSISFTDEDISDKYGSGDKQTTLEEPQEIGDERTTPKTIIDEDSTEKLETKYEPTTTSSIEDIDDSTLEKQDTGLKHTLKPSMGVTDKKTTEEEGSHFESTTTPRIIIAEESITEKDDSEHKHTIPPKDKVKEKESTQHHDDYEYATTPRIITIDENVTEKDTDDHEHTITPSEKDTTEHRESDYDRTTTSGTSTGEESITEKDDDKHKYTIPPKGEVSEKDTTEYEESDYDRTTTPRISVVDESVTEKDEHRHTIVPSDKASEKDTTEHRESDYDSTTTAGTSASDESITEKDDDEHKYTIPPGGEVSEKGTTEYQESGYDRTTTPRISIVDESVTEKDKHTMAPSDKASEKDTTEHRESDYDRTTTPGISAGDEISTEKDDSDYKHTIPPRDEVSKKDTTEYQESGYDRTTTSRISTFDEISTEKDDEKRKQTISPSDEVFEKDTTQHRESDYERTTTPRISDVDEIITEKGDGEHEYTIPPSYKVSDKDTTQQGESDYEHTITPKIDGIDESITKESDGDYDRTTTPRISDVHESITEKSDIEHKYTMPPRDGVFEKETTKYQESDYDHSTTPKTSVVDESVTEKDNVHKHTLPPRKEVSEKEATKYQESDHEHTTTPKSSLSEESITEKDDGEHKYVIPSRDDLSEKETTEHGEGDYERTTTTKISFTEESFTEKEDGVYEHTIPSRDKDSEKVSTTESDYERTTTSRTSVADESVTEKYDGEHGVTIPSRVDVSEKDTTDHEEIDYERTTTIKSASHIDESTSETDDGIHEYTTLSSISSPGDETTKATESDLVPTLSTEEDLSKKQETERESTTLPSTDISVKDTSGKQESGDEKTTLSSIGIVSKGSSEDEYKRTTLPSIDDSTDTKLPISGVADQGELQKHDIEDEHTTLSSFSASDEVTTQKRDGDYDRTTQPYHEISDKGATEKHESDYERTTPLSVGIPEETTSEKQEGEYKSTTLPSFDEFTKDTSRTKESGDESAMSSSPAVFDKGTTDKQDSSEERTTLPSIDGLEKETSEKYDQSTTLSSPADKDTSKTEDIGEKITTLPSGDVSEEDTKEKYDSGDKRATLPSIDESSEEQDKYDHTTVSSIATSKQEIEYDHTTQPTVDVSEDVTSTQETAFEHLSTIGISDIDVSDKQPTDSIRETTDETLLHITSTTKTPTLEEVEMTTEPDKSLNTVPSEIIDDAFSKPLATEKTSMIYDEVTTESAMSTNDKQDHSSAEEYQTEISSVQTTPSFEDIKVPADHTSSSETKTPFVDENEIKITTETVQKLDGMTTTVKTLIAETSTIDDLSYQVKNYSRIPGEGDCLLNGITYRNNSEVPKSNNCHTSCKCVSSIIKCDPIICSPPPKYMDNCQPIYDTPDSCCPTYICQTGETMPPQPDNHIYVTDQPSTSIHECDNEKCKETHIKESSTPGKKPVIDDCGTAGCSDKASAECDNNECSPVSVIPVQSCENENCVIEPEIKPIKDVPLCQNEQDCQQQVTPCIGNACVTDDHTSVITPSEGEGCKDDKNCQKQEDNISSQCTEESCRRKDTGKLESEIPTECSGPECTQHKPDAVVTSTEVPIHQETTERVEAETEKIIDRTTVQQEVQTKSPDITTLASTDVLEHSTPTPEISNALPSSDTESTSVFTESLEETTTTHFALVTEKSEGVRTTVASEVVTVIPELSVTHGTEKKETDGIHETDLDKVTTSPKISQETVTEGQFTDSPFIPITSAKETITSTSVTTIETQTKLPVSSATDSQDITTSDDNERIRTDTTHSTKEITTEIPIDHSSIVVPLEISTEASYKDNTELPSTKLQEEYTTSAESDQKDETSTKPAKSEIGITLSTTPLAEIDTSEIEKEPHSEITYEATDTTPTTLTEEITETSSKISKPSDDITKQIIEKQEGSGLPETPVTTLPEISKEVTEAAEYSVAEQTTKVPSHTITSSDSVTGPQLFEKDTETSVTSEDQSQTERPVHHITKPSDEESSTPRVVVQDSESTTQTASSSSDEQVTIKSFETTDKNEIGTTEKVKDEHITEKETIPETYTEYTTKPLPDYVKPGVHTTEKSPVTQEGAISETEPHIITTGKTVETIADKQDKITESVSTSPEEKHDSTKQMETTTVSYELSQGSKMPESTEKPTQITVVEIEEKTEKISDDVSEYTKTPDTTFTDSEDMVTKAQDDLHLETVTAPAQSKSPTVHTGYDDVTHTEPSLVDHTDKLISQTTESLEHITKEEVHLSDTEPQDHTIKLYEEEEKLTTVPVTDEKETTATETSKLYTKEYDQTTQLVETSTLPSAQEVSTQLDITTHLGDRDIAPDVTDKDLMFTSHVPESHKNDQLEVTAETASPEIQEIDTSTPQAESTESSYDVTSKMPHEATTHIEYEKKTETPIPDISTKATADTTPVHVEIITKKPIETSKIPEDTSTELQTETDKDFKEPTTEKPFDMKTEYAEKTTQKPQDVVTEGISITTVALEETSDKEEKTKLPYDSTEKDESQLTKLPEAATTVSLVEQTTGTSQQMVTTISYDKESSTKLAETFTESLEPADDISKSSQEPDRTTESQILTETTPYVVELEEHTHKSVDDMSTIIILSTEQGTTTQLPESHEDTSTKKEVKDHEPISTSSPIHELPETSKTSIAEENEEKSTLSPTSPEDHEQQPTTIMPDEKHDVEVSSPSRTQTTPALEQSPITDADILVQTEKIPTTEASHDKDILPVTSKITTDKADEEITSTPSTLKPQEKPAEMIPPSKLPATSKPESDEVLPTEETSDDDSPFPPSGYSPELPDYGEEPFGPGTCRYGGKVYVSAQQIPRDDPCDFCFCFRSDIICLQQSCPPPIHGCYEEPIQGFCCPRYECPVAMATTLNVTTTTTTTTTTLPPHFLPHAYKGAAQKKGCQIKGHTYKVGEVVRASSGPCLHCTCGGDGQMKCDPKACTPEPMLRQMIAAAVSSKRRR